MPVPHPVLLYHITHFDNLQTIVQAGGLLAHNGLDVNYTDIAHQTLQSRRNNLSVPCPPHGVLHDYVPFYFCKRSPMLYALHKGKVENYHDGQDSIVYLLTDLTRVQQAGIPFVFTDGHAIMQFTEFYNDPADLDKIDWPLMKEQYWFDTNDDPDRKRRRQAECLLYGKCPWSLIFGIGTFDETMKMRVDKLLANEQCAHLPRVKVKRDWYY
ncbi:MAG: DUF4433 domain-containing protein [Methylococcales bacterium]|nr:DUF4433 domain-containing protein [Methylococcales bacterium]